MTFGIASMTLGIASYITFWYSPKSTDTRNNAKLLQRSCQRLLKKRTGKTLAENLQRTSKNLAKKKQKTFRALASNQPKVNSQIHKRRIAFFDATATATNAELQK